ncbi:MAG: hypothetical protein AAF557_17045 [Pseudomonadota bacterium]
MPGTVKIWWHDGAVKDIRYHDIPVVAEPEVGFETVAVGATATVSGPAPEQATVAIVETDVNVRYTVRPPGITTDANATSSKPVSSGFITEAIGVSSGHTISFIEV